MTVLVAVLALIFSAPARETLRSWAQSPTEVLGCMMGEMQGDSLVVGWIRPLQANAATRTVVATKDECQPGTLGRVHSHPDAQNCWYVFPGTSVPSSDAVSFIRLSKFQVDAIVCGSKLVWVDRQLNQHEQPL